MDAHKEQLGALTLGRLKQQARDLGCDSPHVVDGEVKIVRIAEKMGDPAGDDFPEDTLPEAMIAAIKALGGGEL